jgi:hypothetical protein
LSIDVDVRGGVSETDAHPAHTHTHAHKAGIHRTSIARGRMHALRLSRMRSSCVHSLQRMTKHTYVLRAFIRTIEGAKITACRR